jgi:hypothetical protein
MPSVNSDGANSARKAELNDEALEIENSLESDRLSARENDEPLDIVASDIDGEGAASSNEEIALLTAESKRNVSR